MKKITFLGYGKDETRLIYELEKRDCIVKRFNQKISSKDVEESDLIISFGYRYILDNKFISQCRCPIVNLHISYLPFNRGAHPNFWSFYDDTPSGVSIHLIDEGIDTGPILFQKKINFVNEKTFVETHKLLFIEIENLFVKNIELIIQKNWNEKKQVGKGSFHLSKDLPKDFSGWESVIEEEIKRLKKS